MAYSQEIKVATGLNNRFSFTFSGLGRGYISRDDIHVYINDVEVGKTFESGTDNVLVVEGPTLPAGTLVKIRRITPKDKPIVDWQDTGLLREDILDTANEQLLYALHEVLDGYGLTDVQVDINMNGNKITGVGVDLNDPDSLITVGGVGTYRDDSIAAAQAAAQSATNAYSEYQNAQTERILTEAQRSLAQQAAGEAQLDAASALASKDAALQAALDANAKLQELINAGMPVPIGMMAPFPVNRQPSGWAVVMGQTLQRTVYPQAVTFLTGNDTTPSFTLPDLRGEFVRGADLGRGVDAGRAVGSWQDSQNKAHNHGGGAHTHWSGNSQLSGHSRAPETASGRNRPDGSSGGGYEGTTSTPKEGNFIATDGGADARPRNVALVWCIKLVNHPVDVTQADINAVLAALNTMAQAVNPNNGKYSVYYIQRAAAQPIAAGVEASIFTTGSAVGSLVATPDSGDLGWTIAEAGTYHIDVALAAKKVVTSGANLYLYIKRNRGGAISFLNSALSGITEVNTWNQAVASVTNDFQAGDIVFVTAYADGAEITIYNNNGRAILTRLR